MDATSRAQYKTLRRIGAFHSVWCTCKESLLVRGGNAWFSATTTGSAEAFVDICLTRRKRSTTAEGIFWLNGFRQKWGPLPLRVFLQHFVRGARAFRQLHTRKSTSCSLTVWPMHTQPAWVAGHDGQSWQLMMGMPMEWSALTSHASLQVSASTVEHRFLHQHEDVDLFVVVSASTDALHIALAAMLESLGAGAVLKDCEFKRRLGVQWDDEYYPLR